MSIKVQELFMCEAWSFPMARTFQGRRVVGRATWIGRYGGGSREFVFDCERLSDFRRYRSAALAAAAGWGPADRAEFEAEAERRGMSK